MVIVLGNKLQKSRLILLCISAGLAAGAVTIGGGIGIFTASIGAPYFIYLLIKNRKGK